MSARPLQGPLDGVVDFALSEPVFVGFVVLLLAFVFFAYLFVRRTLLGLREGYDEGRRR